MKGYDSQVHDGERHSKITPNSSNLAAWPEALAVATTLYL